MPLNNHNAYGEPRGKGRPKKDELVVKPFVVHDRPHIKTENRLRYAEDAIKTADKLYKRYEKPYPNPLNIDVKDLTPEARMTWECIFSTREYPDDYFEKEFQHEKALETGEEVTFAFEAFTSYIRDNNFVKSFQRPDGEIGVMPLIPNQSNLARWLGVSSRAIGRAINDRGTEKDLATYKRLLADCLSEGAMAGVYQSSSTVFALKNMCDWADKYEDRSINKNEPLAVKEAEEVMAQLGYTRPQLIGGDKDGTKLPSSAND